MTNYSAVRIRQVDDALRPWIQMSPPAAPGSGWIKAIRRALGMTLEQMGARAGVHPTTAASYEKAEHGGTITLNTLRRAAAALDCELVYAVVPRTSLDEVVRRRARHLARRESARVNHSMRLEDQGIDALQQKKLEDEFADMLLSGKRSALWQDQEENAAD